MNTKNKRLAAIHSIISSDAGSTQEEIKKHLKRQGIVASQSTLSRDLRDMGAVKFPIEGGKTVYRFSDSEHNGYPIGDIGRAIEEFCLGYEQIGNFLVIKTKPGNARDLCLMLDNTNWKELAGTIAGDDTILVVARASSDIKALMLKFKK